MFFLVLRKITNNKWLIACLMVGSILAVAMVSSIPLYTDGILQRMLTKDLEQYQLDNGYYPGRYRLELNAYSNYFSENRINAYRWFDERVEGEMAAKLGLPYSKTYYVGMDYMTFLPEVQRVEKPKKTYCKLYGITDFMSHAELVAGRMPATQPVDGVFEVLAAEAAQQTLDVLLDDVLVMTDETKQMDPIRIRIVGLYRRPAVADAWWSEPAKSLDGTFVMDYDLFRNEILSERKAITTSFWYFALDYNKLTVEQLKTFTEELKEQKTFFMKYAGTKWSFPAQNILEEYVVRAEQLRLTLWVLQAPILLMLAFYIFMVSQLIVENDRNEISVLISRGASGPQLFTSYLLQSLVLSLTSLVVGPFVGFAICRVLGAANGFLEFVSRTALPLALNGRTILYAAYAGLFSVLMMMIPTVRASRITIVEQKQKKARRWKAPIWQKMFLDLILLGVSLYGLYQYRLREQTILVTAAEGMSVPVDPFLYIISTVFVLGAGLLFLRLYPLVIRFLSWAGKNLWTPSLYTTFITVGRSGGREQFLMLFLVLTISIGVFCANSARTINQNIVDRVSYENGADLTLQMDWPSNEVPATALGMGPGMGMEQAQSSSFSSDDMIIYQEPDFNIYSKLSGTTAAARVFLPKENLRVTGQERSYVKGRLMALMPSEFGRVVWQKHSLLPYHINNYLNLLAASPQAVLVSEGLMKELELEVGDAISYNWGKQNEIEGVVFASVKYWPGINPLTPGNENFIIANLNYVQAQTSLEPYQIWYRREPDAPTKQIYDDIAEKQMVTDWIHDTKQEIIREKNDPLLQGTNGAMTLGFVVTLAVSMIGFFIYWILSIQARTLQFGIFRAMGMSAARVILTLVFEQILICGASIFMGLLIGGFMSQLFVPLLGMVYSAAEQVPPFAMVASRADYLRLYAIVGAMLAAGLALLGVLVSRIKVSQAIKLGED